MSQSVKIPSNMKPNWICEINGKTYSYTAGSTQSVPDEVASLITQINAMKPKKAMPHDIWDNMPIASPTKAGALKQGVAVADATNATDVITQVNALIASLVASGAIAEYITPVE